MALVICSNMFTNNFICLFYLGFWNAQTYFCRIWQRNLNDIALPQQILLECIDQSSFRVLQCDCIIYFACVVASLWTLVLFFKLLVLVWQFFPQNIQFVKSNWSAWLNLVTVSCGLFSTTAGVTFDGLIKKAVFSWTPF